MPSTAANRHPDSDEVVGVGDAARILGVSPTWVRSLADEGRLPFHRTGGGHRRFRRSDVERLQRDVSDHEPELRSYSLIGLEEHRVWEELAPALDAPDAAMEVARYAVTEMLNNAIDHSGGTRVEVSLERDIRGRHVVIIADDGRGVFRTIAVGLGLANDLESLAELSKGKRTTDPTRHTGEGIFFSSKAVAEFELEANELRLSFDNDRSDFAYGVSDVIEGTRVRLVIDPSTTLSLEELFERFTEEFDFNRSRPLIKLFELGARFVSRSEAKRLTHGLDAFTDVDLDFAKVEGIGQGFADELFRVWATAHPTCTLHPMNMNPAVEFMVARVRRSSPA